MIVKKITLKEIPAEDRPRERMLRQGAHVLSHAELLAILIRTGSAAESAIELAQRILGASGDIRNLVNMKVEQLTQIKGIGPAKAIQIFAGIELGRRISTSSPMHVVTIHSPEDAANVVMEDLRYLQTEHFVVLYLNVKNVVIAKETISIGSLNASIVHPREVFKAAIQRSSASIVCFHNHPSGDPTPSPEDIQMTKRLTEVGTMIGIPLLDHIIIAGPKFTSLKEHGYL
jgi:DNA repair protein RadC